MTTTLGRLRSPLPWLAALLVVYLISPIGDFLGRLATTHRLTSPGTGAALAVSAETATIATAVVAVVGVPLGYVLSRGRSRTSAVVGVAVQLPIALPPLISGIMLLYLVGPYSAVGRLFGGRLTDDRVGIVLAQVFVSAPFLVIAARSAFAAIDPDFDDVAATLGHGPWSRFLRVAVPIALPGIIAGLMLAWLRGFGEFGATVILAYHPYSLPVFSYVQFGSTGLTATLLPTAAALGTAVVVLLLTAAVAKTRLRVPVRAAGRRPGPAVRPARQPLSFDLRASAGAFTAHAIGGTTGCLAILGPTGAGKTLTLRALAGLHRRTEGRTDLGTRDLTGTAPERRGIGYLPQDSTLLPNLRVGDQVRFGTTADPSRVAYWIDRLELSALADRRPDQLSGGQRRRVALARALATQPGLLLLDEPLTGLDTPSRLELRRMLRGVLAEAAITTVLVTHDPDDVAMLADDVAVLQQGRTVQYGSRDAVYRAPAGVTVARLLGISNAVQATVLGPDRIQLADGTDLRTSTGGRRPGTSVLAVIDPRGIAMRPGAAGARVLDAVDFPDHRRVEIELGDEVSVVAELARYSPDSPVEHGDRVGVEIAPAAIRLSTLGD